MSSGNEMQELHDVEFEMLLKVRDICEKYDLTYYLSGGTFLGAVRHQGFIPWDDDIDVAMPREDYLKFSEVANKELPEGMVFKTYALDPDYHHPIARVMNYNVCVKNHSFSKARIEPAWIDIFPLDGMPEGKLERNIQKFRLLWRKMMIGWANYADLEDTRMGRPLHEKILMFIGRTFKPGKFMNLQKQYEKLDRALMKYSAKDSKVYMNFNGIYRFNSIMSKEFFYGDGATYTFEGEKFNAPANYDAYLTKIYGDYMKLPPVEKRNTHSTEVIKNQKTGNNETL